MLVLFDQGTPKGLASALSGSRVVTAAAMGWAAVSDGELLDKAEAAGFHIFLTTDRRLRYQQNLAGRRMAIVVLTGCTKWSRVRLQFADVASAIGRARPGSYSEVEITFRDG
jgi:hypothetical protein